LPMQLDTNTQPLYLHLDDLTVPADDYELKAEVPVRTRVLCDGTVQYYLLKQTHCTLTVTGRLTAESGAETCGAMQRAMHANTEFSFDFAGASFGKMQITALHRKTHRNRMLTDYSVTLTGFMTEVTAE